MWQVEECDDQPGELCTFAQMCPKIRRTGNAAIDADREALRLQFMSVVDSMYRNPPHIGVMGEYLADLNMAETRLSMGSDFKWDIEYVEQINAEWMATFIDHHTGVTMACLARAKAFEGDVIVHVFLWIVGCSMGVVLPENCKLTNVAWDVFSKRFTILGERLKDIVGTDFLDEEGRVQWSSIGAYGLTWGPHGNVTTVTHRPTSTTKTTPEWMVITQSFSLESNWNDRHATCTSGSTQHYLQEAFGPGEGPFDPKLCTWSGECMALATLTAKVVKDHADSERLRVEADSEDDEDEESRSSHDC